MGGQIALTLFFGVFLAIGAAMLFWGGRSYYYSQQAAHWPTTPGDIIASDFRVNSDSDGDTYEAKVEYKYNPDGYERVGKTIAFGYTASSGRKFHWEIHEALPVGAQVAVRYDPSKPDRSVLTHGVNRSILFILIFGAVWTIFTGGIVAMVVLGETSANGMLQNMVIYSSGR
ncbi:DUF3592 domain-containing protein [Hyphococcus sp.]|jgi:hypothetical protein|uniref:DUF3592 domain-containing protein n=1 Tax=Hyphococcus sp. TaxID=2038636 RepID=UPI003D102FF7